MANKKVLVVDDNADTLNLLCHVVEQAGQQAVPARGGREGQRLLQAGGLDLMILDVNMRELDGWSLVRAAGQAPAAPGRRLPVLIVTAMAPSEHLRTMEAHAGLYEDYVMKPFEVDRLAARVGDILAHEGPAAPQPAARRAAPDDEAPAWVQSALAGKTMATLFDLAIANEKAASDFYGRLAAAFEHLPAVADFWRGMMADEDRHTSDLECLCNATNAEELLSLVPPSLLGQARRGNELAGQDHLAYIHTLEDAHRIAQRLEGSEMNSLYELFMSGSLDRSQRDEMVVAQVRDHTSKLVRFAQRFAALMPEPAWR